MIINFAKEGRNERKGYKYVACVWCSVGVGWFEINQFGKRERAARQYENQSVVTFPPSVVHLFWQRVWLILGPLIAFQMFQRIELL